MRYFIYHILAFSCLAMGSQTAGAQFTTGADAVVSTGYGRVRGYKTDGVYTYKGIPYAQAERFMPPVKPAAWPGIRNAMAYGPVCPQNGPNVIDESEFFFHHDFGYPGEDCLRLNIWTVNLDSGAKKPVMLWLHGGGFATGSGNELPSYDGENLCRKGGVVVVNLNHRLNSLGFLNLSSFGDKYRYSGNNGMLDLVAALHWIRENIRAFGGDPANVTVFGQSGGGRKVTALLSMPSAVGLFHKAIIESGASLEYFDKTSSQRIGLLVAKKLGLDAGNIDAIQKMPFEIIRQAGEEVLKQLDEEYKLAGKELDGFRVRWGPLVDEEIIPFNPADERSNIYAKNIPIMVGSNKNEFISGFNTPGVFRQPGLQEAIDKLVVQYPGISNEYIAAVKKAYPEAKRPLDLLEVDIRTRAASLRLAAIKSRVSTVYNYLFAWESPVLDGRFRAAHCLELPFVFNNVSRCKEMTGDTKEAHQLERVMSQAWINFAKTGNPNHTALPVWEPYTLNSGSTLIFDNHTRLTHHHDKELIELVTGKN